MKKEDKKEVKEKKSFFENLGYLTFFLFIAGIALFLWLVGISLVLFGFLSIGIILFVIVLIAGIWIITRRGFLLKLIAISLFILVLIGMLMALFYYIGAPREIKGEEREAILLFTNPLTKNFLTSYNERNYIKTSRDFSEGLKNLSSSEQLSLIYNLYGKYISKSITKVLEQKALNKTDSISIEHKSEFEKASLKLNLIFMKINETYYIAGYGFNNAKLKEKSTELKIKEEKPLQNITTSKANYVPGEENEYKYFSVSLKNTNDFSIFVNKVSFNSVDMYTYGNLDFTKYPDLKEFCKPFELGEIKSYETKEGCIIFQILKNSLGNLSIDIS